MTEKTAEPEVEENVEQLEPNTVELEVPVSEVHQEMIDTLSQAGVEVEEQVSANVAASVEDTLHKMYQQGRYGQ